MKKRFLTIFYYKDIGKQHLYKDVGSIPLGLAKYCGWDSSFAYVKFNGEIHDPEYEKFVSLHPILKHGSSFLSALIFLKKNAKNYDVINYYHFGKKALLLGFLVHLWAPHVKLYCKLDINRNRVKILSQKVHKNRNKVLFKILQYIRAYADLYSVETKSLISPLQNMKIFCQKIFYLPNGFWRDKLIPADLADKKENIILAVGRLGTVSKNTELLLDSFADIPLIERKNWKLLLVGSYTQNIFEKANKLIAADSSLQGGIIFTGNIDNKKRLNQYYSKAAIFCLPSRWESFGIALLEAIHHGCFPIVTDCCDAFYDILNQGEYGNIIPNENREALTAALMKAMKNKMYTVNCGIQGKVYVDQYFDWGRIIQQLQEDLTNIN